MGKREEKERRETERETVSKEVSRKNWQNGRQYGKGREVIDDLIEKLSPFSPISPLYSYYLHYLSVPLFSQNLSSFPSSPQIA